jgi:hypothetical protein
MRVFIEISVCYSFRTGTSYNVSDEDRVANELALQDGDRLFSVDTKEGLAKIWVITEWDRSVTTVLFPDEY